MKKNLLLYAAVFLGVICIYLIVNQGRAQKQFAAQEATDREELAQVRDSLREARLRIMDLQYFSLETNDDALAYSDHLGLEDPAGYIADKLLETNERPGNNPLVPYEGMGNDFKINKIKILNHKWIITDFSDGKYWGELFIRYELKDDLSVDFEVLDHLLYARN